MVLTCSRYKAKWSNGLKPLTQQPVYSKQLLAAAWLWLPAAKMQVIQQRQFCIYTWYYSATLHLLFYIQLVVLIFTDTLLVVLIVADKGPYLVLNMRHGGAHPLSGMKGTMI